jgi:glycopeptide antibiotics resistance protein
VVPPEEPPTGDGPEMLDLRRMSGREPGRVMASWNADLILMVYVYVVVVCVFFFILSVSQMRWMIKNEWTKENDNLAIKKRYLSRIAFFSNEPHSQ